MISCSGYGQPGCPSRYYCYWYKSDELAVVSSNVDEDHDYVCLCNKRLLYHGEDCVKNSPLFYLSVTIKIVHAIYTLFVILFMIKRLSRRRTAKGVMAASVLCLLVGLTTFTMYVVEAVRAFPGFDDRLWEASWQTKITSLLVFLASLNVLSVGVFFLDRLQAVGVIRGAVASMWRMATICSQLCSVAGCFIMLASASSAYILVFGVVSMLGVACLMAVAAFRTRHFLQLSSARRPDRAHSNIQIVQRQLIMFVKTFCFWLGLCFFFGVSIALRSSVESSSGAEQNLLNLGLCLSLHQLGLVESDYFLLPEERPTIMYLIKCMLETCRWANEMQMPVTPCTYDSSCPGRHHIWTKNNPQGYKSELLGHSMKTSVLLGAHFPPSSNVRQNSREAINPLPVTRRLPSSLPAAELSGQRRLRPIFPPPKVEPDRRVFPVSKELIPDSPKVNEGK
mmetsp:Transcript_41526/g.71552  ORF Transcript_41526/g.71552 Transcript_41526/m.71552 type:complete len:451 (+) Transcript_41526:40-1392(+)